MSEEHSNMNVLVGEQSNTKDWVSGDKVRLRVGQNATVIQWFESNG